MLPTDGKTTNGFGQNTEHAFVNQLDKMLKVKPINISFIQNVAIQ
jgi:hypothetical protein